MRLSRTLILTNFPLYINYINIKNRKKNYKKTPPYSGGVFSTILRSKFRGSIIFSSISTLADHTPFSIWQRVERETPDISDSCVYVNFAFLRACFNCCPTFSRNL